MSRNREYLADASGVQLTRYPPGLISALEKLRDDHAVVHHATKATAQMWIEQPLEPAKDDEARRTAVALQQPVRHAPSARGPHQAAPGDVVDVALEARHRSRRRNARHRECRARRGGATGGDASSQSTGTTTTPHRTPPRRSPRPPRRRRCSLRSPAWPTRRARANAAGARGEGREHARRTTSGRHRPGRRGLRRRGRGQHHALPRHLQLDRARDHRPRPLGSPAGSRHRVADPRHLRLLRRRGRAGRCDQRRAGARRRQQRGDRERRQRDGAGRARAAAAPIAAQPLRSRPRAVLARGRPEAAAPAVPVLGTRRSPAARCRPRCPRDQHADRFPRRVRPHVHLGRGVGYLEALPAGRSAPRRRW